MKIKPGRRQLADSLLAAQGDGHPDHTIEGAFRDLLGPQNKTGRRALSVTDTKP